MEGPRVPGSEDDDLRRDALGAVVDLTRAVSEARALGFEAAGVVTQSRSGHAVHYRQWLKAGRHGGMAYLAQEGAVERRSRLEASLPGFRSAVVVAHSYADADPGAGRGDPAQAVVARYARGRDYHGVVSERLEVLGERLEAAAGRRVRRRVYVDAGPVLERELGMRAGLGWFGKNTMLIDPGRGSYFFLGVLMTDLDIPGSRPFEGDHCGTCRRCIDACPTGALLGRDDKGAPVMDARLCISYLTIEHKGPLPRELRPALGNHVFGCDICQEACPWNLKFAAPTSEPAYAASAGMDAVSLVDLARRLLSISGKQFQREFVHSPVSRAGRKGLLRNVCVALGNWGSEDAIPVLDEAMTDPAPLVRAHAAWALGRIGSERARAVLAARQREEAAPEVSEEMARALASGDR